MNKKILFSMLGRPVLAEGIKVQRMLPNKFVRAIGSFVLLDYVLSREKSLDDSYRAGGGTCVHPHRGVATLTYIINGEVEHVDSMGNHVKLSSGGVHWMKAGKGIVHAEAINTDCNGTDVCVAQFWINLPAQHKCEDPEYISLGEHNVLKQLLNDDAGWIKILSGTYKSAVSKIPCYSKQFLYHIQLKAGKQFSTVTEHGLEYGAFLPKHSALINDTQFETGELIFFDSEGETIEMRNDFKTAIDILLFGGEPYAEPIVAEGTFVMNTQHEITQAYNDYYDGKYGQIKPDR